MVVVAVVLPALLAEGVLDPALQADYSFDPTSDVVNVYVTALRNKIGAGRIETVRGAGYRLRVSTPTDSRPSATSVP